jgi:DNA-binding NarL/FixJ family response regulator
VLYVDERTAGVRVLLVDDHKMMRHALAQLLDGETDIRVVGEASDGEEGVRLALELRPSVVLMDVSMPGVSGIEATRRIRAEIPDIRIIGLSMHDMDGTRESMLDAGADDYLTKDGPPEDLIAAIRQACA